MTTLTILILIALTFSHLIVFLLGIQSYKKRKESIDKAETIGREAAERLQKRYEHRMDEIHK